MAKYTKHPYNPNTKVGGKDGCGSMYAKSEDVNRLERQPGPYGLKEPKLEQNPPTEAIPTRDLQAVTLGDSLDGGIGGFQWSGGKKPGRKGEW